MTPQHMLIALAMLALSCASRDGYTCHARVPRTTPDMPAWTASDLGPVATLAARVAVEEWNRALNGHVHIRYMGAIERDDAGAAAGLAGAYVESVYMSLFFVPETFAGREDGALAWVDADNPAVVHVITDLPAMTEVQERAVIVHEIGHALGLPHMAGTLMAPVRGDGPACIDRATAETLARLKGWDAATMNWCEP